MKKKLSTPPLLIDLLHDDAESDNRDRVGPVWDAMNEIYEARMRWIKAPFGNATDEPDWDGLIEGLEPDWDKLGEIAEMEDFAERGLGLS
jgi:hypothetical protein